MDLIDLSNVFCSICETKVGCPCFLQSASARDTAQKFAKSLQKCGFVQIVGHGVAELDISNTVNEAEQFFSQTNEVKEGCISKDKARRGYSPSLSENFASLIGTSGKPNDLVQKYRIGPIVDEATVVVNTSYYTTKDGRIHFYPNNERELVHHFPVTSTQYYKAMEHLALQLLRLILYTSGVPSSAFDNVMDKHTSILSLNYYEPMDIVSESTDEPLVRVEMHTDVSLLTIVAQSAELGTAAGVLQVFVPNYGNGGGEFITVPYVPGSLVVNIGDCLHDWSQGRFPSALHRVVNLPLNAEEQQYSANKYGGRYSLAYFCAPNYDARMEWPSGAPSLPLSEGGDSLECVSAAPLHPFTDYSTWRKLHIKKSMQQLKKNTHRSMS